MTDSPHIAVSTWALHALLGKPSVPKPGDDGGSVAREPAQLPLGDLAAGLRRIGAEHVELCHFHLTDVSDAGLDAARDALAEHGVALSSLLIDAGDVGVAEDVELHLAWIERWIARAGRLGAGACRVSAGHTPPTPAVTRQVTDAFARLADAADAAGLRLRTENWFEYTDTPGTVLHLLDALEGRLGLCLDFKNWDGRLDDIAALAPRAGSCHVPAAPGSPASPGDDDAALDTCHMTHCLRATRDVGFAGTYAIVQAPGDDPWASLAHTADHIAATANVARVAAVDMQ